MASLQGWGRQTWNSGAWNSFAPVEATGNGLSSSVGSVSLTTTNIFGVTGINIASSVGNATQASEYAATGNALTSARGQLPNPTIVDNQLLTGWNRGVGTTLPLGWSTSSWGNGDFVLTVSGNALTTSIGDEVPTGNADVTVTGLGTTSTVGQAQSFGLAVAEPSGNAITSSLGIETVTGSSAHTVTGIGLTSSIGDEIAQGVPQSGWNRGANQVTEEIIGWSDNLWGTLETSYSLSGNSLSIETNLTGFTGSVAPTITGTSLTASASAPGTSIDVSGVAATSAIGTFSISGDNNLTIVVTEDGMTSTAGTLPQTIDAPVLSSTSSIGAPTITADANVTATGNALSTSLGTEVVTTDVVLEGVGGLTTKVVTVVSTDDGNKYFIDGVRQDTLELAEGNTYRFDQSDNSNDGHPLRFSETPNGTHGGGSEYTTGVTTNGTPGNAGAYTQIQVASGAPTLYYYCQIHSGMGGQANTPSSALNAFSATGLTSATTAPTPAAGAIVSVSGNALTSSLGDETQETSYEAPSVELNSSVGNTTVIISVDFTPTGVSGTSTTGTLQGTFWSNVDDSNSGISWTEVHEAA